MLSCEEVTRLVSESLDRQLPLRQRLAVRMHFLFCEACTRYEKQLLFIRKLVRHFPADIEDTTPSSAPALSLEARERIKRSLRVEDQ